jgi:hypothetical protein
MSSRGPWLAVHLHCRPDDDAGPLVAFFFNHLLHLRNLRICSCPPGASDTTFPANPCLLSADWGTKKGLDFGVHLRPRSRITSSFTIATPSAFAAHTATREGESMFHQFRQRDTRRSWAHDRSEVSRESRTTCRGDLKETLAHQRARAD